MQGRVIIFALVPVKFQALVLHFQPSGAMVATAQCDQVVAKFAEALDAACVIGFRFVQGPEGDEIAGGEQDRELIAYLPKNLAGRPYAFAFSLRHW